MSKIIHFHNFISSVSMVTMIINEFYCIFGYEIASKLEIIQSFWLAIT